MVRKRRQAPRLQKRPTLEPSKKYPTKMQCCIEIFRYLAEGAILMASGIVVGVVLGQGGGTEEAQRGMMNIGSSLFVFGAFARFLVLFLEVQDERND